MSKLNKVIELLLAAGWKDTADAQWTGIEKALPDLTAALALPDAPWPLQTDTDAQFDKKLTVYGGDAQPVAAQPVAAREDMPAICAALGFDPTNHHNAAKCPYCTPQPVIAPKPLRTDVEIVEQTEKLAGMLMRTIHRREKADDLSNFRASTDARAQHCWTFACEIQEMLTDTDPENAVAEIDGIDAAEHGQPVTAPPKA